MVDLCSLPARRRSVEAGPYMPMEFAMISRLMHLTSALLVVIGCLYLPLDSSACGSYGMYDLRQQLQDPRFDLQMAATQYRQLGPGAVVLLSRVRDELAADAPELVPLLDKLLDKVAAQRHAAHSRLFWYTDLADAQRAAAKSGKPILSLRLLGKLDEQFSCANSRFFRTTLYANQELSDLLRDQFVLHWKSVRPVPKVTIDFGDGRLLQRTVTGNSIHYVVTHDGAILEALPGLYAPEAFKAWLERALRLNTSVANATSTPQKQVILTAYHQQQKRRILQSWQRDIQRVQSTWQQTGGTSAVTDRATVADLIAASDDTMWELIAATRGSTHGVLDAASIRLIRNENPVAAEAQDLSTTKSIAEDPVFRMVRDLERTIEIDTVRNEYLLHRRLHDRLISTSDEIVQIRRDGLPRSLSDLNTWVYDALFRSPLHDPWLGLLPANAYNALDRSGVTIRQPLVSAALRPPTATLATD